MVQDRDQTNQHGRFGKRLHNQRSIDILTISTQAAHGIRRSQLKSKSYLLSLFQLSAHAALSSLKYALPLAIFSLRFLEWLYSPSSPAQVLMKSEKGIPVPPPIMLLPHPKGLQIDTLKYGICPLCQSAITNATALPSGFVYCYRCAYEEVERNSRCPITFTLAKANQLRKVLL